jgi:hypothetical protein
MGFRVEFTPYGDAPFDTTGNRGLFYGVMPKVDAQCMTALHSLAVRLEGEGRRFMIVTTPIHPDWTARYDADGQFRTRLAEGIKAALAGTGGEFWDSGEGREFDGAVFLDAIHLHWSAAAEFAKDVVRELRL